MPGPAFATGETVSLHPIEDEDHEFLQYGRNHPNTRKPLTETTIRSVDDVPEMLGDHHYLVCVEDGGDNTEGEGADDAESEGDHRTDTGDGGGVGASGDDDVEDDDMESDASNLTRVGVVAFTYTRGTDSGCLMYWTAPEHRGRGYVSEAVELFLEYAFAECGFHKVFARVLVTNEPSIDLLESMGFEREGRFREEQFADGEWTDAYQYAMLDHEWLDG